jgi:predicted phage-related endonuclease
MSDPHSPEWHAERQTAICGTDAGQIALEKPQWGGPHNVYQDKLGLSPASVDTETYEWGRLLEPLIRQKLARELGVKIKAPPHMRGGAPDDTKLFRSKRWPFLGVHPDGFGPDFIAECKTYGTQEGWGEPGTDQVPQQYAMQAVHTLAVLQKYDRVEFGVLFSGHRFRHYTVRRDPETEAMYVEIAERFWFDHVVPRIPPPIDGTEGAARFLAAAYPVDDGEELQADDSLAEQCQRILAINAQTTALEAEKLALSNVVKAAMGEATTLRGPYFRATWKMTKGSTYTVTKPDGRRFLVTAREED